MTRYLKMTPFKKEYVAVFYFICFTIFIAGTGTTPWLVIKGK